jgi:predicted chitinase
MASSRLPGVLTPPAGFCKIPSRTPGVLGWLDQGDPTITKLMGYANGITGLSDWGAPHLPGWLSFPGRAPGTPVHGPDKVPLSKGATAPPATGLITRKVLKAAEPDAKDDYLDTLLDGMNKYAKAYKIDTPLRVAHFLAQISHESHLKVIEEGGSYSGTRMREIFGCKGGQKRYDKAKDECTLGRLRDKLWTDEATYAHNPKNLLSYVYADRFGNGAESTGDGYTYRGRGMMQLTFKSNYAAFTKAHNAHNPGDKRDFVSTPDLLAKEMEFAVESAFFYWDSRSLNAVADTDDIAKVTAKVNGGSIGLPDRTARLARIKKALGI